VTPTKRLPGGVPGALVHIVAILAVAMTAFALLPMRGDWAWLGALGAIAAQGLLVPFTVRRAHHLSTSPQPFVDAAVAVTTIVTVLIFGFAAVFMVLSDDPGQVDGLETKIDAVYFTVTTVATVGTGDIHAEGQLARFVATIQILVNLTVLGIAVRLLTTVAQKRRQAQQGDAGRD
jgi:voltage-gated potassium channel